MLRKQPKRQATRLALTVTVMFVIIIAVLGVAGLAAYHAWQRLTATPPPAPACWAGPNATVLSLSTDQAAIAATIAGVAARRHLPEQALTIAYATALQESDLQDLDYGDRDSLGVFQQRPSQGWGTPAEIENPVYATTRFFEALVKVPRYTKLPVATAAQDVQHSADGSAYGQYEYVGGQLAGYFSGKPAMEVSCWYTPAAGQRPDLKSAAQGLGAVFGAGVRVSTGRYENMRVEARPGDAWTVVSWLVTHAQQYQLSELQYAGYEWKAADGSMGWQRDSAAKGTSIVAG